MKLLLSSFFLLKLTFSSLQLYSQQSGDTLSPLVIKPVPQQIEIKEPPVIIKNNSTDTLLNYKKLLNLIDNNTSQAAQIHISLADIYTLKRNDKEAISNLLSAQKIYNKLNDKPGLAQASIRLAAFYERNTNLLKAEKNYLDAIVSFEQLQDEYNSSKAATHLSLIYFRKKNYTDALKYASYSLNGYTNLGIKDSAGSTYVQMAAINMATKNYRVAEILILKQALSLYRSAGNKQGRIRCFDVLGHIYHEQQRYSEAKWFFLQANTLARNLGDTKNIILSLVNVGKVKVDIKDYNLARKDFREAEALAKKNGYVSYMASIASAYSKYYISTGDPAKANKSVVASVVLNDSARNIKNADLKTADKLIADVNLQLTRPKNVVRKETAKRPIETGSNYLLIYAVPVIFVLLISLLLKYYRKN